MIQRTIEQKHGPQPPKPNVIYRTPAIQAIAAPRYDPGPGAYYPPMSVIRGRYGASPHYRRHLLTINGGGITRVNVLAPIYGPNGHWIRKWLDRTNETPEEHAFNNIGAALWWAEQIEQEEKSNDEVDRHPHLRDTQ